MGKDAEILALRRGDMECVLCPERGGSIARLTRHGPEGTVELLRPASDWALASGSAIDMGCFPLVPFSNRIDGGRFRFDGRDVELPLDMDGCPHAIHGHGWRAAWTVEDREESFARLVYRHAADGWPWRYGATQDIVLEEDGLHVALDLVNEDSRPMPAGIGLHPYFPKPPGTRLDARVHNVWMNDPTLLPAERAPLPAAWDFPEGVEMDRTVLDNGFTGWDGRAALTWPGLGLRLTLTADGPFGHLVIYAPRGEDYLCVEPVTHMTDAVNRSREADAGLCTLQPGESLRGTIRLRLEMIPS
ncbi:aldose 1-epimerase [Azospirillum sp. sgz302134]